ncbi:MAG: S24 family peptidase [Armatimonadetes bacterium]|nr:S24 family peptidase [Armatimonadota bacterium]
MLVMALRKEGDGDVAENPLVHLRDKYNLKVSAMYAALRPQFQQEISLGGFRNYFYREVPNWLEKAAFDYYERGKGIGRPPVAGQTGRLKVIGGVGAGGSPSNNMHESELEVPIEFADPDWRGFVVESDGRSMMPYIQPGDTVIVKPDRIPKQRKFMVISNDRDPSELYVKKVLHDGEKSIFVSTNPGASPLDMTGLSVVGLVVGVISADSRLKIGPYEEGISGEYIDQQFRLRLP